MIEEKFEDTVLQEDPPDYMMEVDSIVDAPSQLSSRTGLLQDSSDTLSSKLLFYCPTLFSSLTSWEKEALDKSEVLSRLSSQDSSQVGGGSTSCPYDKPPFSIELEVDRIFFHETEPSPTVQVPLSTHLGDLSSHSTVDVNQRSAQIPHSPVPTLFTSSLQTASSNPTIVPSSLLTETIDSVLLPGYMETEEETEDQLLALESLGPIGRVIKEPTIIPTYLEKRVLTLVGSSKATSSKTKLDWEGKNFA